MAQAKKGMGRPTVYDPKYCKMLVDFFTVPYTQLKEVEVMTSQGVQTITKEVGNELPLFEGFAVSIGVHRETILNWIEKYPDFFDAYKKAKDYQKKMLSYLALNNYTNPAFSIFLAKNITDLRDKTEQVIQQTTDLRIDTLPNDSKLKDLLNQ